MRMIVDRKGGKEAFFLFLPIERLQAREGENGVIADKEGGEES